MRCFISTNSLKGHKIRNKMKWIDLANRILAMSEKDQQNDVLLWDWEGEAIELGQVQKAHETYYHTEYLGDEDPITEADIETGIQNGVDWGSIKKVIKKGEHFLTIK